MLDNQMAVSRLCCCSEPSPNISVYKNLFWFDMNLGLEDARGLGSAALCGCDLGRGRGLGLGLTFYDRNACRAVKGALSVRTELRVHADLHAVEAPSDGARGPLLLREGSAILVHAATGAADLCRRQLRRHGGKLGGVLGAKKEVGADQGVDIWRSLLHHLPGKLAPRCLLLLGCPPPPQGLGFLHLGSACWLACRACLQGL